MTNEHAENVGTRKRGRPEDNKAAVYDLLFRTAETLLTIAADPKHLGARIGLTAVPHTWGSTLLQAIQRDPSGDRPPPGTMTWTCG